MTLVAGVDSSTQSCTIVLRDADDGRVVGVASAPHPRTTPPVSEQDPRDWWTALTHAAHQLPLDEVGAISFDGQGHGLVALDADYAVIRPAKLWNDTTSAPEAAQLALAAPARSDRAILIPYLDGERTPNRPFARGTLAGLRSDVTREELARAVFEGVICGLLDGLDALARAGARTDGRLIVTGGGGRSAAYRQLLADLTGRPVYTSDLAESAAAGAAIQAAAVLHGKRVADIAAAWAPPLAVVAEPRPGQSAEELRSRYRRLAAQEELDG